MGLVEFQSQTCGGQKKAHKRVELHANRSPGQPRLSDSGIMGKSVERQRVGGGGWMPVAVDLFY